ncbi:MAG: hypothetical protein MHM6MM_009441 [Cercozoa sp. M6MM]
MARRDGHPEPRFVIAANFAAQQMREFARGVTSRCRICHMEASNMPVVVRPRPI